MRFQIPPFLTVFLLASILLTAHSYHHNPTFPTLQLRLSKRQIGLDRRLVPCLKPFKKRERELFFFTLFFAYNEHFRSSFFPRQMCLFFPVPILGQLRRTHREQCRTSPRYPEGARHRRYLLSTTPEPRQRCPARVVRFFFCRKILFESSSD